METLIVCDHGIAGDRSFGESNGQLLEINLRQSIPLLLHGFVLGDVKAQRMYGFVEERLGHGAVIDIVEAVSVQQPVLNVLNIRIEFRIPFKGIEHMV